MVLLARPFLTGDALLHLGGPVVDGLGHLPQGFRVRQVVASVGGGLGARQQACGDIQPGVGHALAGGHRLGQGEVAVGGEADGQRANLLDPLPQVHQEGAQVVHLKLA